MQGIYIIKTQTRYLKSNTSKSECKVNRFFMWMYVNLNCKDLFMMVTYSTHYDLFTLNIKQEYLLQFLSLNIDSDVYREIFVTSPCTTSVPKQTPDVTYRGKNGDVAGALNCHCTLTWPNLLYPHTFFDWPATWTFLGKRPRFHRDRWYSEWSMQALQLINFFFHCLLIHNFNSRVSHLSFNYKYDK